MPAEKAEPIKDQLQEWRDRCAEGLTDLKDELDKCNARVSSKKDTAETCVQELWDYVEKLDACAVRKAFAELK